LNTNQLKQFGISYADEVMNYTKDINDAISNSYFYVSEMAKNFAKQLNKK